MKGRTLLPAALISLYAGAMAAELQEQQAGALRYLTGGVGQAEQEALRRAAPQYNLALTFAAPGGQFLAGVAVAVKDHRGETLLLASSAGPMMLLELPPGRYTVEATYEGHTLKREVAVADGGRRQVVLRWRPEGGA